MIWNPKYVFKISSRNFESPVCINSQHSDRNDSNVYKKDINNLVTVYFCLSTGDGANKVCPGLH